MSFTPEKSDIAAFIHTHLCTLAKPAVPFTVDRASALQDADEEPGKILDYIQILSGFFVESCFLFEKPDVSMEAGFMKLSKMLRARPCSHIISREFFPNAHSIDSTSEKGRAMARFVMEEWQDCEYGYADFILTIIQNFMVAWEEDGVPREESLRLFMDCSSRCMAFEVSAQELCDLVIETKIGHSDWSLADAVCSLSAYAGFSYGQLPEAHAQAICIENGEHINSVMHVMTQEASRMGVPAGSDWHLGISANDSPADPPTELLEELKPVCDEFFKILNILDVEEQAVACAKAAGRMLAVISTGDTPDMPHAIAKPLAMAALVESYRSLQALDIYLQKESSSQKPAE